MASAFSDSSLASGGLETPPKISGATEGTTMKFLPDVGIYKESKIKKKFDIIGPVCKLQIKIQKIPIFGIASSRHANFTKFYRNINIDVRYKP